MCGMMLLHNTKQLNSGLNKKKEHILIYANILLGHKVPCLIFFRLQVKAKHQS